MTFDHFSVDAEVFCLVFADSWCHLSSFNSVSFWCRWSSVHYSCCMWCPTILWSSFAGRVLSSVCPSWDFKLLNCFQDQDICTWHQRLSLKEDRAHVVSNLNENSFKSLHLLVLSHLSWFNHFCVLIFINTWFMFILFGITNTALCTLSTGPTDKHHVSWI